MNTLDGNQKITQPPTDESAKSGPQYYDEIIAESGKKSRGGLNSISELYAPGVQLVGGEILSPTFKSRISLGKDSFSFNTACVRLFKDTQYIEMVIDKKKQRLIAKPSTQTPKESVRFARCKDGTNIPRRIIARKFLALLFNYMQWSVNSRYRIMAIYQLLDGQELLVFNLDEAVEVQATTIIKDDGKKSTTHEYYLPVKFRESFGDEYSEVEERRRVGQDDMFLFIDPKAAVLSSQSIEPKVPEADDIIKSNYRKVPGQENLWDYENQRNDGGK